MLRLAGFYCPSLAAKVVGFRVLRLQAPKMLRRLQQIVIKAQAGRSPLVVCVMKGKKKKRRDRLRRKAGFMICHILGMR
jgi:hypothetical protein